MAENMVGTDVPSNYSYQDPVPWAAPVPGWRGGIKNIHGSCHATMLTWVSSTVSSPLLQCQTLGSEATCPTLECRANDSESCMVSVWKDHLWGMTMASPQLWVLAACPLGSLSSVSHWCL